MHLAYSALRGADNPPRQPAAPSDVPELVLRYRAYLETCDKYRSHIGEIQKYLPGWTPKFR
jgi:hypothetical protein